MSRDCKILQRREALDAKENDIDNAKHTKCSSRQPCCTSNSGVRRVAKTHDSVDMACIMACIAHTTAIILMQNTARYTIVGWNGSPVWINDATAWQVSPGRYIA